ncbi:hypothetical protein FIBSPDRAFT_947144 [Athelia psychrophila]|uniref:Uncharacterized protein n=1 Tax=Athelia psychrophila TaxID=1759441 RepID=A0A166S8J5_9AGAM|nr:hypothetical protein FIBSPDRAFT_947144 [Fibularhizoctonia sp. CBS 109695]
MTDCHNSGPARMGSPGSSQTPAHVVDGVRSEASAYPSTCVHPECTFTTSCVYREVSYVASPSFAPTESDLEKLAAAAQTFADHGITVTRGPVRDLLDGVPSGSHSDLGVGLLSLSDADAHGEADPDLLTGPSGSMSQPPSSSARGRSPSVVIVSDVDMSASI